MWQHTVPNLISFSSLYLNVFTELWWWAELPSLWKFSIFSSCCASSVHDSPLSPPTISYVVCKWWRELHLYKKLYATVFVRSRTNSIQNVVSCHEPGFCFVKSFCCISCFIWNACFLCVLVTTAKELMFLPALVCYQNNSKSNVCIILKFLQYVVILTGLRWFFSQNIPRNHETHSSLIIGNILKKSYCAQFFSDCSEMSGVASSLQLLNLCP